MKSIVDLVQEQESELNAESEEHAREALAKVSSGGDDFIRESEVRGMLREAFIAGAKLSIEQTVDMLAEVEDECGLAGIQ